ncbi:MAG: hypothetical protein ACLGI6_08820 [Gammaproteobacteria bacterium]
MDAPARQPDVERAPAPQAARLPEAIRTRINQLAHHCGQRHEAQVKASLLDSMRHLMTAGASLVELTAAMDRHEAMDGP